MPYAIPYARFSSGKQAKGSSLERQKAMLGSWLQDHADYTLFPEDYEDLGRSGSTGEHLKHGFGRLLEAIRSGRISSGDVILLESIDRAGRLPELEMLRLIGEILEAGVSIITIDDGAIYDENMKGTGKLWQLLGKVQQAYTYSETLSRRVQRSYETRQQQAREGKPIRRRTPVWLNSEGALREDIAPLIQLAFEDYASGLGERRILQKLRGQAPEFAQLNPSTIKRWLRNRTAIGYWNEIPDVYPAVVPKDLFYRVQNRLEARYKPASAPTRHALSGLVACGRCGSNFTYKKHKNSAPTMGCSKRARLGSSGCTNSKSIPAFLLDFIQIKTSYPAIQRALTLSQLNENQQKIIALTGELEATNRRMENLLQALEDSGYDDAVKRRIRAAAEQKNELQAQIALLESSPPMPTTEDAWELDDDLRYNDDEIKLNAILQSASYRIVCDGAKILVNEECIDGYPAPQRYTYGGMKRSTQKYVLIRDGIDELHFMSPREFFKITPEDQAELDLLK